MPLRLPIDLRSERGTTLIELLVAIPAALVVAGAAMAMAGVFSQDQGRLDDRSAAVSSAQIALDRLTRDVRQASLVSAPVAGASGSTLQLTTIVGLASGARSPSTVFWSCSTAVGSLSTCTRRVGSLTAAPSASFVISTAGGGNTSIFSVSNFAPTGGGSQTVTVAATPMSTYVSVAAQVPTTVSGTTTNPTPTLAVTAGASTLNT